ncbi:MAG TPA: IspD/TarI family cytidylyltransferase [Pseudonocardiaceae bacterium]|nr:IspD/TarI family cytidylyltransferase [Pseudonocardiaceae bacterium]
MPQTDTAEVSDRRVAAGVVLASGSGSRMGAERNKVYLPLAGRSLVSWSVAALGGVPDIEVLILVARPEDKPYTDLVLREHPELRIEVVTGGATRQESELMALRHLAERIRAAEIDVVLIHDAARPLVAPKLVGEVVAAAREFGGAIPGLARDDLLTVADNGIDVVESDLGRVVAVQTPQGFRAEPLLAAYEQAALDGFVGTDTASCIARYTRIPVRCIAGDERNLKITYPHDLPLAEGVLAAGA